jgi:hypothetical protein
MVPGTTSYTAIQYGIPLLNGSRRHYGGTSAIDVELRVKNMGNDQQCNVLENWFVHEIVIQSHIPPGVNGWLSDKPNEKFLKRLKNVFNLSTTDFATNMSLT